MRVVFILLIFITVFKTLSAQIYDPASRAKRAAENKVNNRIDRGIDKGLDKAEEGIESIFKKKNKKDTKSNPYEDNVENKSNSGTKNSSKESSFSSYGKFDFIPGDKVIAIEDFSQDALGDFPAKWNTNGSGELVKLNDNKNKFLKTVKEVVFYPEFINKLPDNFTLEFDIATPPEFSFYNQFLSIGFTSEPNVGAKWDIFKRFGDRKIPDNNLEVALHPTGAGGNRGMTQLESFSKGQKILDSDDEQDNFKTNGGRTSAHVSIWRQKNRIRVYLNESKIWDIPRAFPEGAKVNSIYFRNGGSDKEDQAYFIGNLRVAVGAPDTRNKLITEGKFVTTGILFDVGSDQIKPESNGVLKDIANVLSENEDVNVKIVGHTDSDGDDATNVTLSKRRAESVKKALATQFGIDNSRMTTDGKGEAEPIDKNTTAVGKANNRRVEFIKQ